MTVIKKYNTGTAQWEAIAVGQKGDTGEGLVKGGTTNQILTKLSNTDFDTQWVSDIDVTSVTQDKAVFNIPVSAFSPAGAGEAQWNIDEGTLDIGLDGAVSLHVGQESLYYVKNQTGSQINVGTLVCSNGTLGSSGRILIAPWTGSQPVSTIMGLTTENIADGADGYVTHFGKLRGVNTTGSLYTETWNDGDILYAGPSGGLTKVKPTAPNTKTIVALVIKADANGTLFIRPTFSSSIGDDDLVEIASISDNDILRYNSANGRFENESLGTAADADTGDFATSAQGALADTAVQPSDVGTIASQDANSVNIDGGTIDGTAVNATTLTASGDVNFDSGTLFVDASTNNVGIGTSSPVSLLSTQPSSGTSTTHNDYGGDGLLIANTNQTNAANSYGGAISWSRSGTSSLRKAAICSVQTTSDQDPNGLAFLVSSSTSVSGDMFEAMRIDSSGHAIIPAGVTLGTSAGVYNAANTLDDYEEGTFTVSDSSGAGLSITSVGNYVKVGGLVYFGLNISYPSNTSNSETELSGLPFVQKNSSGGRSNFVGWHDVGTGIMSLSDDDGTRLFFYIHDQSSNTRFINSDFSNSTIFVDGVYPVP